MEPTGNEGVRGELDVACDAVATMEHIGHPDFGANEAMMMGVGEESVF